MKRFSHRPIFRRCIAAMTCSLLLGCGGQSTQPQPAQPITRSTIDVTEATFPDYVLASDKPVVVDLWAPWCGPCKQMEPVLEAVASEYDGRAVVAKVNIDEHPAIAQQYSVSAIPTLLFFRNGEAVDRLLGVQPKSAVAAKIDRLLAATES